MRGVCSGPSRRNGYRLHYPCAADNATRRSLRLSHRTTSVERAYFTTRLKLTVSVIGAPVANWNVPVTVSGYVPTAVPGGSTPPPPPPHDGNVATVASRHNKKINPYRRRPGFTRRLPGSTTNAANPVIPASPTSPAIRFPFECSKGDCRKPVACVVVAVTWTCPGVVTGLGTVHVAKAGAPLQLSATDGANPSTAVRSTVKIAVCPGTTVRLVQVVVRMLCAVPVIATVCGLPVALSVTLTDAVAAPGAVGENVTLMVQWAPATRVL